MSKNDLAFPQNTHICKYDKNGLPYEVLEGGLTKREYFAGLAMQALLGGDAVENSVFTEYDIKQGAKIRRDANEKEVADWAVHYSDALLSKLEEANGN